MGNFSVALSGLQAESVALNTIGNNLANLNTTAFKGQTTSFEDLFYQQIGQSGSGNAIQVGAGTKVSGTSTDFTQGTILPDENMNAAHMAVAGDGFFVVEQGGVQSLTRAGNFQLDSSGNLITQDGQQVMGYPSVDSLSGRVNQNTNLEPITIPLGKVQPPHFTFGFYLTANLDSRAAVGTTFSSPVQIYDSLGQSHQLTVNYIKTATNTWNYSVTLPAGEAAGTPLNNTGTMIFDPSGLLLSPAGAQDDIVFSGLSDGAKDLTLSWAIGRFTGKPTITQVASDSTNIETFQNGYSSGIYQSFTVDSNGLITLQLDNGQTMDWGQIALATVPNPSGLIASGNNNYEPTSASGQASIGLAGTGGRGTIDDGALEQSNVNVATEFSNLIVAQRAFEGDAKTVSTFDTISKDVLAMVR
jgi:flagellar hook protein FlgE